MPDLIADRYEPLLIAGRGGEGEVIKARDTRHDRLVALKRRRIAGDADPALVLAEARTLLELRPHPNLPLVRDDFTAGDQHHLVMDWVEGVSLQLMLERDGPMSIEQVLRLLQPVADALDHLHAHDPPVVHGDVKPANLVATPDGRVVLVDFGTAARACSPSTSSGTPGYIAPEVGVRAPNPRADVYSLAATAFTLLAGAPPGRARPPWGPGDDALEAAFRTALSSDPTRRPASAGAFVQALRGRRSRSSNLPSDLPAIVGRERELAEVKASIAAGRLTTLTGMGGIGKSRLAVEVAAAVAPDMLDGAWLVDLTNVDDDSRVLLAVANALGVTEKRGRSLERSLLERAATRQMLLILDGCERVVSAAATLAAQILRSCPNVAILATSREPLGDAAERVIRLAPLSTGQASEAVELFTARAGKLDWSPADLEVVAEICRRLDGIPLAIELAAARAAVLSPAQILDRLDRRFELLRANSRPGAERQRTLRATLDWSYDLLTTDEQTFLRRIAVFAGGFSLDAAEQVCDVPDALDLVASLADRSLIVASRVGDVVRYRLLETVREYAASLLEPAEGDAARHRHLAWFIGLAEQADAELDGPEQVRWLNAFDLEHANLTAAMTFALERDADASIRLGARLWRFWLVRRQLSEGRGLLDRALTMSRSDARSRSRALAGAGVLAWAQGDYEHAARAHEEALALARSDGDELDVARALGGLGLVAHARGSFADALALHTEALALRRHAGDQIGIARSLTNLGQVAQSIGDYERAAAYHGEALEMLRGIGDTGGVARATSALGLVAQAQGRYAEARTHHAEALAMFRTVGDDAMVARTLSNIGLAAHGEGDFDAARAHHEEALRTLRRAGDKEGLARTFGSLGLAAQGAGHLADARSWHEQALALRAEMGDAVGIARSHLNLARVAAAEGEAADASALYVRAFEAFTSLGDLRGVAEAVGGLATVVGDPSHVARLLGAADALREQVGFPVPALDRAAYDVASTSARSALGDTFDVEFERGRGSAPADTVAAAQGS